MNEYIKRHAESLVIKYRTRNPFELAKAMNINVVFRDFQTLKGFYTYHLRNRYIGISQNLCQIEQQLSCAHEIGHDQMHRNFTCYMRDFDLFTSTKIEHEANIMAAHILIPDNLLDKYHKTGFTIDQIAAKENLYPDLIRLKFKHLSIF